MAVGQIIGAAAGLVGDLFNSIYGVYQDQRNFQLTQEQWEYKQAMDKLQMEREDTAVQRRVADLKAAGLNPNLAAGGAASAGVGASTPSPSTSRVNAFDLGKVFDVAMRKKQLDILNQQERRAMYEADMASYQSNILYNAQQLDYLTTEYLLGTNGKDNVDINTGEKIPLFQRLSSDTARQQYMADLAGKENSMYYINQFSGLASDLTGTAISGYSAYQHRYQPPAQKPLLRQQSIRNFRGQRDIFYTYD